MVNRGEAAVRLVRGVRELNSEYGYGIVRCAAYGRRAGRDVRAVRRRGCASATRVIWAPRTSITRSWHGHCSRLGRRPAGRLGVRLGGRRLRRWCDRLGVTFIGPPAEAMRRLGDKVAARNSAEAGRRPGRAVERRPGREPRRRRWARRMIGYPLSSRRAAAAAVAASGWFRAPGALEDAFERTRVEAQAAFGEPVVFLERMVRAAGTSRCRSSPTSTARLGARGAGLHHPAPAAELIEESAARAHRRAGCRICARRRGRAGQGGRVPAAPARWSTSTSRRSGCSPSSR